MRVSLKGVNPVKKTLADGTVRTHYYLGRGKGAPKLEGEPGSPEFMASYERALAATRPKPAAGILQSLVDAYQRSVDFTSLASRTRDDYVGKIILIEKRYGTFPVAALTDPRTRGEFKAWRDELAVSSLRQADLAWTVLARILAWSVDRGLAPANPCEKGGRLYKGGSRRENVWTDEHEAAFMAVASPELRLALQLALWTGLRQGDLLRLPWSAYEGEWITVATGKSRGKTRLDIPVAMPLKAILDATAKRSTQILTTQAGRAWTEDGFRSSFRKAQAKAGVTGVTFHDTRGTAVSRLALEECTEPEIATITGHSLASVRDMLDDYLHRDKALAVRAIGKLERRTKPANRAANRPGEDDEKEVKSVS